MLNIVTIKLIAPKIDDTPAKCKLNIAISTAPPGWPTAPLRGGYKVQPVPAPPSIKAELNNKINDGTSNQKLTLLRRGNAISGAPIINGTNQLPKPPIIAGITIKNTMINACAVIKTL